MATIALLGSCDTKLEELLFLRDQILQTPNTSVILIDVGRRSIEHEAITITQPQLISRYGGTRDAVTHLSRDELVRFMSSCATKAIKELLDSHSIHAIISAGGSGGTSLATKVMRDALPVGFPKMMVSTVASGDTGPYVGETDITMMYSVVDVAGLNQILRDILGNAGAAIAAAAHAYLSRQHQQKQAPNPQTPRKKRVGITMFGVTTPGVDAIRHFLESPSTNPSVPIETYIFHATGHGGRAMERLIRERQLDAVLDITTTEIVDHLTGGVMSAGPGRLAAAARAGIPTIVSLGATDMTNFGPRDTVPERYQDRKLYVHNPVVTLMRSSADECRRVGEFICDKLKAAGRPEMVQVWIPRGGVSMLSTAGGPFEDREADEVLFGAVREGLRGSGVVVVEDERDVNDGGWARDVAGALVRLMGEGV
ncbi:hypothetical protein B0T17DRAFT_652218 [Bombardia bombarda]|uniref:Uncharacterized protein n=1 Tax=Bombardia bombarda TaxID=252184 RepID=A0AA39X7U0_9PEZI|nr:hypothetical protein B0T17DRAFT_652218 [Bombardia bombarda]